MGFLPVDNGQEDRPIEVLQARKLTFHHRVWTIERPVKPPESRAAPPFSRRLPLQPPQG
jgi:hypothetical protein